MKKKKRKAVKLARIKLGLRLTAGETPSLAEAIKKEIDGGVTGVVFDMGETVTLDSRGIRFILATCGYFAPMHGVVRLVNVPPDILKSFESMGLLDMLHVSALKAADL